MPTPHRPSLATRRALRNLGADIRLARKNRGLPAELLAQRAFTSRPTLHRIEMGDHTVGIGIYAAVLNSLGLLAGLANIAAPSTDETGRALAESRLPQRTRLRKGSVRNDG